MLNHKIYRCTGMPLRIDLRYNTINTKALFNNIATIKPNTTMVPSTKGNGIIPSLLPALRMGISIKRMIDDSIKHRLQTATIFEKKRMMVYL